jgi:hypothetical protein
MTRDPLTVSGRSKLWLLDPAAIEHERTAGGDAASAGWIVRTRYVALQDQRGAGSSGLRHRHGRSDARLFCIAGWPVIGHRQF